MKCFVILCVLAITYAKHIVKDKEEKKPVCEGIKVHGKIHEEKVLINGINRPYQLSYYKKNSTDHILYFSYNVGLQNESTFMIGYAEAGYPVPKPVTAVKNGFATALNHKEEIIYLGGSEGIYVRNLTEPAESAKTHLLIPNHDIWDIFYKHSLYFIAFPSRRLYKVHSHLETEKVEHIHEKLYQFVIDGDGDTFISNKTGLYMIRKDSHHRIHMKGATVFRAFEVNRKGVAYFCGQNEVYVADKEKHSLVEIATIKNIFGLTFDEDDNMIYSDPHQIVKLLPKDCK